MPPQNELYAVKFSLTVRVAAGNPEEAKRFANEAFKNIVKEYFERSILSRSTSPYLSSIGWGYSDIAKFKFGKRVGQIPDGWREEPIDESVSKDSFQK